MEAVREDNYRGYSIKIYPDESADNPIKEWDVLGKYICWHKRYDLENCRDYASPEEVREYAKRTGSILYPLFMYEHSGIALSLNNSHYPFTDRWDAGQLGFILVDRQEALEKLGKKKMSKKLKNKIYKIIQSEVDTYNSYLAGDVYGYVVEKNNEQIDSCWGIYGMDDVEEKAKSVVDADIRQTITKHCQQVKNWIRNSVPFIYRFALSTE